MNNNVDSRESNLLNFIDSYNKEKNKVNDINSISNDPNIKLRKVNDEANKGKSIVIDEVLGKIYKDALPFDDPERKCSAETMGHIMKDFIYKRTDGKDSEYYIREAIKRTNSPTLKKILTEAENIASQFRRDKSKNIGTIDPASLNFKELDDGRLSEINKKLDLEDISNIIHNNVQQAIKDEVDKAKAEEEYNKQIQDSLAEDPSVRDDTSMESAMNKINFITQPTVYQPSLFEAIVLGNAKVMTESTNKNVLIESVHEYTKLNVIKALKLESFDLAKVRDLANSYL